ncbi:MAG TPA: hypothetical protein VFG19_12705, partial [Geobacteraceae bacterium]|nr:hypothetical protein [Geobacteraceae bacterium]
VSFNLLQHQSSGPDSSSLRVEWRKSGGYKIGIDEYRAVCLMRKKLAVKGLFHTKRKKQACVMMHNFEN